MGIHFQHKASHTSKEYLPETVGLEWLDYARQRFAVSPTITLFLKQTLPLRGDPQLLVDWR